MVGQAPSLDETVSGMRNSEEVQAVLVAYFARNLQAVMAHTPGSIQIGELPLARIKRIMKQDSCDPHPRMVSAETIPVMAYAAQLFIGAVTSVAWNIFTQRARRNTLQVKDLKAAVLACSHFDFLLDVLDMYDIQQQQFAAAEATKKHPMNQMLMGPPPSIPYRAPMPMPNNSREPRAPARWNIPMPDEPLPFSEGGF